MARSGTELTRLELERDECERLSPCAMRSADARRGVPLDRDGRVFDYRTEFQRDRDRILHSRAFRRLRLKSRGGAFPPAERYRDRLSHTLEVSQLSRTAARGLGLNEDLVEAIALGHELGMPPFAQAGEAALDALLSGTAGGFRYTAQSLRVVERVEKRYRHPGLNLTDLTREGILKHAGTAPCEDEALRPGWPAFAEARLVGTVDRIASCVQDLDDGLRAGELDIDEVERLPLVRELLRRIGAPPRTRRGGAFMRTNAINRGLTHMMVTGIIQHSRRGLRSWARAEAVATHEAFLEARSRLAPGTIGLTAAAAKMYDGLREFISRRLHEGAWLRGVSARARNLIGGLFGALKDDPRLADDYLLLRFKEEEGGPYLRDVAPAQVDAEIARRYRGNGRFERLVADHIAGMTDTFLLAEHERILGPPGMGGMTR